MYYTIYKVTNKINGKIYIGSHKTKNLDDNYMGSGKYLKYSQEKHGLENFTKEILFVFDNSEDMFSKEAELVNEEFIAEENTYNIKIGGFGGWDYINTTNIGQNFTDEGRIKTGELHKAKIQKDPVYRKDVSDRMKRAHKEGKIKYDTFTGKKHSKETKNIMSEKAKERLKDPTKNSQYGTRWIHSLVEQKSKKIRKEDSLPDGWLEGRKIKFMPL